MTTATTAPAPAPRSAPLAPLGWAGFVLLLYYAVIFGGSWLGMYMGGFRVINLVIVSIGLLAWLIVAWRRPRWRPSTAIWPTFAAPIAAFILSVAVSDYQRLGLEFLAYAVLLTALYLLLVRIMASPHARERIGGAMAILAFIIGGAYVLLSVMLWIEWWGLVDGFRLPPFRPAHLPMAWGSPSVVLTVQTLVTVVAIGGLGFATRGARSAAFALVVLLGAVAIISGSRSGWLSLGGAVVLVGALVLIDARARELVAGIVRARWFRIALVPALVILAAVALIFGPAMIDRLAGYGSGGRLTYWATALRMFGEEPLLGQGPGTWMVRRAAFTEPGEVDFYQPHAHNQYVQTAAELGLVGLAAGVIAIAAVGWLVYRASRDVDAVRRRWAWAATFALTYLALNIVVDTHTIVAVPLLVAIPVAILDGTSARGIGLPTALSALARPLRLVTLGALVAACTLALLFLWRFESAALTYERANSAALDGEWAEALGPALDAAAADPDNTPYQLTAALALARNDDWEAAETGFRRVIEADGLATAWLGLARAQVELGRPTDEVVASLEEAWRLGEQQPALAFAVGGVYDLAGMPEQANEAYVHVVTQEPSLAADSAWRSDLGAERFTAMVDAAMEADPEDGWEIALMAGDTERARELAGGRGDARLLLDFIDAWEGDPEAIARVGAEADRYPMDALRLARAARVHDRAGAHETAARYRRLLRLGPNFGPSTINVSVGERESPRDAQVGTRTYYYGTHVYRRMTLMDLLPPGLPGLVSEEAGEVRQLTP